MSGDEEAGAEQGSGSRSDGGSVLARRPATASWLKIVLFVAGVVVGVLAVGLLDTRTPDFATSSGSGGRGVGGAATPGRNGGGGVEARVNAACLAVINDAQDVYGALTDLGPALDDNDLMALDEIVRRLQPVEPRLADDLRGCRIDTSVGSGGTPVPGSAPTAAGPNTGVPLPSAPSVSASASGSTPASASPEGSTSEAPTVIPATPTATR